MGQGRSALKTSVFIVQDHRAGSPFRMTVPDVSAGWAAGLRWRDHGLGAMLSSCGGNGRAKVKLQAAGIGADCHPHARGMKMTSTPDFGDGGCGRMRFPWQQNGSMGRPEGWAIPSERCTMLDRMWTSGYLHIWTSGHLDI